MHVGLQGVPGRGEPDDALPLVPRVRGPLDQPGALHPLQHPGDAGRREQQRLAEVALRDGLLVRQHAQAHRLGRVQVVAGQHPMEQEPLSVDEAHKGLVDLRRELVGGGRGHGRTLAPQQLAPQQLASQQLAPQST